MSTERFKQNKIYYSIKEVAEMFRVTQSLLRYWEEQFPTIKPGKTAKGIRQYSQSDIDEIRIVHFLVKERGMTLTGAKQKLKENREKVVQTETVINRLKAIHDELMLLKNELDDL